MYKFTKCKTILANTYSLRAIPKTYKTYTATATLTSNFTLNCGGSRIRNVTFCDQDATNTSVVRLKLEQMPELNCGQQYKIVIDRPAILEDGDNYSQLADDGSYNGSSVMFTVYNSNCSVMNYFSNFSNTIKSTIIAGGKFFANTSLSLYSKNTNLNKQTLNAFNTNITYTVSGFAKRQGAANLNTSIIQSMIPYNKYSLYSWGYNLWGQLGLGDNADHNTPTQIGSGQWDIIRFTGSSTFGIKSDGTLWSWGNNGAGQLGLGDTVDRNVPTQIGTSLWSQILIIPGFFGIQSDGTLWSWGYNNVNTPTLIPSSVSWSKLYGIPYGVVAIKTDGTLWYWDSNTYSTPNFIQFDSSTNWSKCYGPSPDLYATKTDGTLWKLQVFITPSATQVGTSTWSKIYYRNSVFHGIKTDGTLWAMGTNTSGQLGDGTTTDRTSLVKIGTFNTWSKIWMDDEGLCRFGLNTDQGLCCWGNNTNGRLGIGNTTNKLSPYSLGSTPFQTMTNIIIIRGTCFGYAGTATYNSNAYRYTNSNSLNLDYNSQISTNAQVYVWGLGQYGSLGVGNSSDVYNPTSIGDTWLKIFPNGTYTFGIKRDGTLWVWGTNSSGVFGNGSFSTSSSTPVQVGTNNTYYDLISIRSRSVIALTN